MPESSPDSQLPARLTLAAITLVLLVASFLGTPLPGTNEPHYLSKARATADPTWCTNDFFLQSENAHAVFFAIVGPLAKHLPFTVVLAIGRTVSLLIVALGFRSLCQAVGCVGFRAVIAVGLFFLIGLTGNFSGEWVIGGFESKVPAYGFAFLCLARCIRNRQAPTTGNYVIAGSFAGLSIALHPVVGMWTVIAISMTETMLWIRPTLASDRSVDGSTRQTQHGLLRRGLTFVITSVIVALPGLLPAFNMLLSSSVDSETKLNAKQIQVFYRLAHHLDPTRFSIYAWCHTAVLIAVCGIAAYRFRRPENCHDKNSEQKPSEAQTASPPPASAPNSRNYLLLVLFCSAVIAMVGVAIGWHEADVTNFAGRHWRASLLQFYPFRLFDALLPLTAAIFLASISLNRTRRSCDSDGAELDSVSQWGQRSGRRLAVVTFIVFIACAAAALLNRAPAPSGYSAGVFSDWKEACGWIKANTPKDAIVFAPRESFGLKLYAERAEYVCFKDCPQDAGGIVEWNRRLWVLHRWAQTSYLDELFSQKELAALNQHTGIQYILTRRLGPFESQPVWSGKVWSIYQIESSASAQ